MSDKKEIPVKEIPAEKVVSSEQAPLALANLISSGMIMKDAKKKLGIK
jgi:hypothetical protein|tara:strand:+ start:968 stop:1111 length:144 start_codon:yes stop_codon:yes gene_type:complete